MGDYAFVRHVWRNLGSAAIGFLAVLGLLASVPAGIVYFILLALGRALRRKQTLSNFLRIVALIWFFIIPLTVLYVSVSAVEDLMRGY